MSASRKITKISHYFLRTQKQKCTECMREIFDFPRKLHRSYDFHHGSAAWGEPCIDPPTHSQGWQVWVRGFAKLKNFQKSKINLDRAHPTHPPPIQFFCGNPSLTWTNTQIINNQQLLAMYRQNTHGILLQNISTGLGLFWDDFTHTHKL